ncbi:hypothetical protein LQF12_08840 [Ruania suaedae]|uniref:hypothetical protein n=1 Tax=Ruania suaedae TaxID=2897774 RepID=UPI001E38B0EC|nr:hypothetical protein [Ruania suaedae]UFU01635.1 hypothetical protein LQF12_08840 [Ruania suaedae]
MPDPEDRDPAGPRPEPSDREVEERWAELTSRLQGLGAGSSAGQDEDDADTDAAASTGPRDYAIAEEPEEAGFVPPDPPALSGSDPLPTLAWLAALGGPVATVIFLIVWPGAPSWIYLAAILTSVVGWLVLLWRMPRSRDDDADDGAVV